MFSITYLLLQLIICLSQIGTSLGITTNTSLSQSKEIWRPTIDEPLYFLGQFNAISNYNNKDKHNLSKSNASSINLYQLSENNDSVTIIQNDAVEWDNVPIIWSFLDDENTLMVIDGEPFIYNLQTSKLNILSGWNNVSGQVNSLYYDEEKQLIYLGGYLAYNNTYGAIVYDHNLSSLSVLPFGGFNKGSEVNSIVRYDDGDSIIFAGSFNSIGYKHLLEYNYNSTIDNSTTHNYINSSSIEDISQLIYINPNSVSTSASFGSLNSSDILCPSTTKSNIWSLPYDQLGSWSAQLPLTMTPSKIRIYNSQDSNSGVAMFRVISSPANGIMNLTYIDPETLEISYCDAFCILFRPSQIASELLDAGVGSVYETFTNNNKTVLSIAEDYQDFAFVNLIGFDSFTIQILDYYGNQAALRGVELYRSGIAAFANGTLNEINCETQQSSFLSSSDKIGDISWKPSNYGYYLYSVISISDIDPDTVGIRYNVEIPVAGQYAVYMYTSGCLADDSCDKRGIVNATLFQGDGSILSSKLLYQTNELEKYDVIYSGEIEHFGFPPYITMTLHSNLYSEEVYVVAESVLFDYVQLNFEDIVGVNITNSTRKIEVSIPINCLLEYSLANFTDNTIKTPIGNSSINLLGSQIISQNSSINGLYINNSNLLISGDFESKYGDNLIGVNLGSFNKTSNEIEIQSEFTIDGGLNGPVDFSFISFSDDVLLFGPFNGTVDTTNNSFDQSVIFNGKLEPITLPNASNVDFLSDFVFNDTNYLILNYNNSNASVIYDYSNEKSFQSSNTFDLELFHAIEFSGTKKFPSLVLGEIIRMDLAAKNIVSIRNSSFSSLSEISSDMLTAGIYLNSTNFALGGKNIFLVSKSSSCLLSNDLSFDNDSVIKKMLYYDDYLFFTFNGIGSYRNHTFSSFAAYDMLNDSIISLDVPLTSGSINTMGINPDFHSVIVAGNFTSKECDLLCTYDFSNGLTRNQTVSNSLLGTINDLSYFNYHQVLLAGDFSSDNNHGYFGLYNTRNGSVSIITAMSSSTPGLVKKFIFADERKNSKTLDDLIIVMGSDYIGYFNSSRFTMIEGGVDFTNANLVDFALVNTSSSSSGTFYENKLLIVTGFFTLYDYGQVSSAIFDGDTWYPLSITSTDLNTDDAIVNSVIRMTSPFIFSSTASSVISISTGSSTSMSMMATSTLQTPNEKNIDYFTNGQATGVGCALAIGTMLLLTSVGALIYFFSDTATAAAPLQSRVGEEKMINALPPEKMINNMDQAKQTSNLP